MKYILSFLMPILVFLQMGIFGTQICFAQTDISVQSGISVSKKYFQANVYGEFESSTDGGQNAELNSWALRVKPFDFLSVTGGTLVYGGIWSRFNNPSPLSISALKQPYALSTRLITNLPGKETKTAPPSVAININFPFLKITTFMGGFQKNQFLGGVGTTLPFHFEPQWQSLPAGIRGTWTLAWRVAHLAQKEHNTWFIPQPVFLSSYYHSFIQELALKTKFNTLLFTAGFSQSPYGKPSGFIRTEYSLAFPVFVLNGQFFMCDIDYLGQNGSFKRDTMRIAINPQLRLSFFGTAIRSVRLGITAETTYQNTTNIIPKSDWHTTFKLGADVQFVMLSLGLNASISDLLLAKNHTTPDLFLYKDSLLKIQSKVLFRPWYASAFMRTWSLQCNYEKYVKKPDSTPNLSIKGDFSGSIIIAQVHRLGIRTGTEIQFNALPKITLKAVTFFCKVSTDLYANFFKSTQRLQLNANMELDVKEKKLDGLKADFSVILKL